MSDRAFCPKGEHRTHTVPVVCVANKNAETRERGAPFPAFPYDVANLVWVALWVVFAILLARRLLRWRRDRGVAAHGLAGEADEPIELGNTLVSPTLGLGDLYWITPDGRAALPRSRLNLHVLIGGATGTGKSTTVERIEMDAVRIYRPQVIHFDCKGRKDGAARFLATMLGAGYEEEDIRIAPVEPYDGWRGDERAHLNRLLAVQDFSDNQPYYTAGTKDLLQQIIAAERLPRLSGELVERLTRDHPGIDPKVVTGALTRYRGFFTSLHGLLDGSWAFDDVDAAYIELPGMARREDAIAFGRYLLEDFMHYIAERKDPSREVLLVLDDFSAISTGDEAVNLVERAREFGVGVILTTQSFAGLGPGATRIVDACNGALIVHAMSNPDPFIERAGTVWRQVQAITEPTHQPGVISSILFSTKPPETPRKTTRDQEFPRIDANEVRSLPPGDAFVIADGRAQRIRVYPMDVLDEVRDMPLVGPVSLVQLGRATLAARKKLQADLHLASPADAAAAPPPDDDPDLDF
jgi:hypothetical protein